MSVTQWLHLATSGLSTLIKDQLPGGASRMAALLLPQILPVFSVVAPCHTDAALRNLVLVRPRQATRSAARHCGQSPSDDRAGQERGKRGSGPADGQSRRACRRKAEE